MWDLIHEYGVYFLIGQYPHGPLGGWALTLVLAILGVVLALPLGLVLSLCLVSPFGWLRHPVMVVLSALRGTPLLMVVFWAYFVLPSLTGHETGQFSTMLVSLVIFDSSYLAEIFRAGIQSLPRGQMEAARSLGFPYLDSMRLIMVPQALRSMLPSIVNQLVSTIKETSLGYIIALPELSFVTGQIGTEALSHSIEVYGMLVLSYFIMCFSLSRFAYYLERRMSSRSSMRLEHDYV